MKPRGNGKAIAQLPPAKRAEQRFALLAKVGLVGDLGKAKKKPAPQWEWRPCRCRPHGRAVNHGPHFRMAK